MKYSALFILLLVRSVFGATYYVDFDSGNDAAAGTSTATAWKTIPGTYKADGSGFLNAAWGSITTSARIPDNTIIKIKCGTTHSSAAGGYVWLGASSGHFYSLGYSSLIIQSDTTWGTGTTATLDGDGMTIGIGLILCQIDGVTFRGLNLNNSDVSGLHAKEKAGDSSALTNLVFDGLSFFNNGKSYLTDAAGAGDGQLNIRKAVNVLVTNCAFNGDQNYINGVLSGDNHKTVTGSVINCTATNHLGDIVGNDSGIGFKALNGQLTFKNCTSRDNLKGFDLGEQSGDDADITYKVLNCTSVSNAWGVNFNCAAAPYLGAVNFYLVNSLVISNAIAGMNVYSGPFHFYAVHNYFQDNGLSTLGGTPLYNNAHMIITPNSGADTNHIEAYIYNNIFTGQRAGGGTGNTAVFLTHYFKSTNDFTFVSDYNSYVQSGANTTFCSWSDAWGAGYAAFSFGANGPGHASGNWYLQYGNDTTPPALGTGHYHSDAHSKGTGCDDTTAAPINSDYMPTATFAGLGLSDKAWYISEMGTDRAGKPRNEWTIGAYEYVIKLHRLLWRP